MTPPALVDVFLNIVPVNPVDALARGNMLQIIFFAILFGFGLNTVGEKDGTCSPSSTEPPKS